MAGFAAARLADLIGILRSRAHPKNISDWYVRVERAGCGNVIRNVNEKIGKKLADLCVGHPARVSTESGIGVKVIEPICETRRRLQPHLEAPPHDERLCESVLE